MTEIMFTNESASIFCSSMEYLLHAGISVADALHIVAKDEKNPKYKAVIQQMAEMADEGHSLSTVLVKSNAFDPYVYEMLKAGEETGRTEEALRAVSHSCARMSSVDRQLKNALMYPAVLLMVMLAVIIALLIYVLPIFDSVYSQLGSGLSGLAGKLLSLGKSIKGSLPVLFAVYAAAILFLGLFSAVEKFRGIVLARFWRQRGDKGVAHKMNCARFARGLAMGIGSGMDVDAAIELASNLPDASSNIKMRAAKALELLSDGKDLADALCEAKLMPATECRMLEAGIRGGESDRAMNEIALRLEEEADYSLSNSTASIEPTIVIVCAILTGTVLLSVMLPLINIMSVIG